MLMFVLGSSGMLGQAIMKEAQKRNIKPTGLDLVNADIHLDISDRLTLERIINEYRPDVVINAAAITSLDYCDKHPENAYLINARPVAILASICRELDIYLVQISTDHYFTGDGRGKHAEDHAVTLVNEYARTKFAGEQFALTNSQALVIRTNIVGFRSQSESPTFVEWVFRSLENQDVITLFHDFFTSSISTQQFSYYLFELITLRPKGILNLASSEVTSKQEFIEKIARKIDCSLDGYKVGSVNQFSGVRRADSLGLNVAKAENILQISMPGLDEVVDCLISEYRGLKSGIC
ncbi:MAG: NAD(P)-dependent oxidoreductase [Firmicutes bacterium HGW-Firmicutes-15]|nr:MAG: NAD(P)-dependent oxidoreductase [Firmicutes bacterium HGW-Firmicutes-15]